MARLAVLLGLTFVASVLAIPTPQSGIAPGTQFITGVCTSAVDCASGCCVSQGDGTAQCKARIPTEQAGKSCDFGGAAAAAPPANAPAASPAQAIAPGTQFITGVCTSPTDCASGCCVDNGDGTAQCKARIPTEEAGKTCDFGAAGGVAAAVLPPDTSAAPVNNAEQLAIAPGTQFITGPCTAPTDCASGCCVDNGDGTAQCKARIPTEEAGKTCDFGAVGGGNNAAAEAPASMGAMQTAIAPGTQFITGVCTSPVDCASGCCVDQGDGSAQCKARIPTEQSGKSCDFSA